MAHIYRTMSNSLAILFLALLVSCAPWQEHPCSFFNNDKAFLARLDSVEDYKARFWNEKLQSPTSPVQCLLDLEQIGPIKSFKDLVQVAQERWIRCRNIERWDQKPKGSRSDRQNEYMQIFESLGLMQEISLQSRDYDAVLISGARTERVLLRIRYFLHLYENLQLEDKPIYFLAGDRPLIDEEKKVLSKYFKIEGINTEKEMIQKIAQKNLPKTIPWTIVEATKLDSKERLNTYDKAASWFNYLLQEEKNLPKKYLIVSNQPYSYYQQIVFKEVLYKANRSDIQIELAAEAARDRFHLVEDYLDTIGMIIKSIDNQTSNS